MGKVPKRDSTMTDRDQLSCYLSPPKTKTYHPLHHIDAVHMVIKKAEEIGYKIRSEEYGVANDGNKMFGIIKFEPTDNKEYTRVVAVKNSYDKSIAFGIVAGLDILVCSNLIFNGNVKLSSKHTKQLNPQQIIDISFLIFESQCSTLGQNIIDYKKITIHNEKASHIVLSMAKDKIINASDVVNVMNEYKRPTFSENEGNNLNSLYNAFTYIMKKYSILTSVERHVKLNAMFSKIYNKLTKELT